MRVAQGTARVLCCTVEPHPDAMTALAEYAPQAELLDVTGDELGYGLPDADKRRLRDRVRFELLALWATDPRYADTDEQD